MLGKEPKSPPVDPFSGSSGGERLGAPILQPTNPEAPNFAPTVDHANVSWKIRNYGLQNSSRFALALFLQQKPLQHRRADLDSGKEEERR